MVLNRLTRLDIIAYEISRGKLPSKGFVWFTWKFHTNSKSRFIILIEIHPSDNTTLQYRFSLKMSNSPRRQDPKQCGNDMLIFGLPFYPTMIHSRYKFQENDLKFGGVSKKSVISNTYQLFTVSLIRCLPDIRPFMHNEIQLLVMGPVSKLISMHR